MADKEKELKARKISYQDFNLKVTDIEKQLETIKIVPGETASQIND